MTRAKQARITAALLVISAMPIITACQQQDAASSGAEASAGKAKATAPASFERETNAYTFTYEYPAQAVAIPALAAMLDKDRDKALAELEKSATEAQTEAKADSFPFNAHMTGISWKVTGENATLLAMLGEISSFAGGAHGNTGYEALIWDKAASKRLLVADLFSDATAAMAALRQPYCDALDAERADRRREYGADGDDMFDECPPLADLAIVPYAGSDGGFDRIMLIAAPYVAGPYAEGAYEVSLPLTDDVLALVKPEYRKAFITTQR